MDTDDGVKAGEELSFQSLPSKAILGASSHSPTQACVGESDSKEHACLEELNDIAAPSSFTYSVIPTATHFSPMDFDSWSDMTNFWTGEGNEQVIAEPKPVETQCQVESPEHESPQSDPNIDYHSITWDEPNFYDFGACNYLKNWSTYVRNKEKPKWSIHDNSEYGVLLREMLAEFAAANANSRRRPQTSSLEDE